MTDAVEIMARALCEADGDCARCSVSCRPFFFAQAQAALSAYHEWLAANGLAIVPVEPTSQQHLAGQGVMHHGCPLVIYSAMIAAAKG